METWICSVPPSTTTRVVCPYVFAGVFLRRAADMFFQVFNAGFCATAFHLPARSFVSHRLAYQTLVDGPNDGLLHNAWIVSWWLPRCPCGRAAPDADALKHQSIFGVCENDVVKNETENGVDIGMKMENRCLQRAQKPKWKIERRAM